LSRGPITRLRRGALGLVGAVAGAILVTLVFWRLFPWLLSGAIPARLAVALTPISAGLGVAIPAIGWGFSIEGVAGTRRSALSALLAAPFLIVDLWLVQWCPDVIPAARLPVIYLLGAAVGGAAWGLVWGWSFAGRRFGTRCGLVGLGTGLLWTFPAMFLLYSMAGAGFGLAVAAAVLPPAILGLAFAAALLPAASHEAGR
jgi:hypothetical protein